MGASPIRRAKPAPWSRMRTAMTHAGPIDVPDNIDQSGVATVDAAGSSRVLNLRDPKYDHLFPSDVQTPKELETLFDAAKFQVSFQVQMAERLDNKARGLIAITTAFAGAVQAYVLRSDVLGASHGTTKTVLVLLAAVTVGLLATAAVTTMRSVVLSKTTEVPTDQLLGEILPALQSDRRVPAQLVYWHLDLADGRKKANDSRVGRIRVAEVFCFATLVAAVLEFFVSVLRLL